MDTRTRREEQAVSPTPVTWLTTDEVMEHLRIGSKVTLRKYRSLGLPVHDLGGMHLFDIAEVDAWVKSRCSDLTPGQNDHIVIDPIKINDGDVAA